MTARDISYSLTQRQLFIGFGLGRLLLASGRLLLASGVIDGWCCFEITRRLDSLLDSLLTRFWTHFSTHSRLALNSLLDSLLTLPLDSLARLIGSTYLARLTWMRLDLDENRVGHDKDSWTHGRMDSLPNGYLDSYTHGLTGSLCRPSQPVMPATSVLPQTSSSNGSATAEVRPRTDRGRAPERGIDGVPDSLLEEMNHDRQSHGHAGLWKLDTMSFGSWSWKLEVRVVTVEKM